MLNTFHGRTLISSYNFLEVTKWINEFVIQTFLKQENYFHLILWIFQEEKMIDS